jgi:hypothetical protein
MLRWTSVQSHHHYEQAFEHYLRLRRMPYVAVHEARKALLPVGSSVAASQELAALKSFDFVLYAQTGNLLAEVKGRKIGRRGRGGGGGRLECWVTQEDIASLSIWERLFGEGFEAAFVFVYWCEEQPSLPLFEEIFAFQKRWYAIRAVTLGDYVRSMRVRSPRWGTVHMSGADFDRVSRSLAGPGGGLGTSCPEPAALHIQAAEVGSFQRCR